MKLPDDVRAYFQKQGSIGARKRAANLTPERRSEIATIAAETRWANKAKAKPGKSRTTRKARGEK